MQIGAMVNTPQGIGYVSGILPGSRQVGGESVRQAEVQTGSTPTFPEDEVSLSEEARRLLMDPEQSSAETQQSSGVAVGSLVNTSQGLSTVVRVMPDGEEALAQPLNPIRTDPAADTAAPTVSSNTARETPVYRPPNSEAEMTPEAREALQELQSIDRAVRTEEKTHAGVAGAYGSSPEYSYVRGPDGKQYAVGGSVSVDTSSAVTPEQAERAAGAIAAAAASVNTPSSADFAAVAQANRTQNENSAAVRPNEETANTGTQSSAEAEDQRNDPMSIIRETAAASYNSWNQRPSGARLDIAA